MISLLTFIIAVVQLKELGTCNDAYTNINRNTKIWRHSNLLNKYSLITDNIIKTGKTNTIDSLTTAVVKVETIAMKA